MEHKNLNDGKGLVNHNIHFYYPAGGGSLNSVDEIFDYFKRTNFSYAISCRELPDFRGAVLKDEHGYTLYLSMQNSNFGWISINLGKRMTQNKMQKVVDEMTKQIEFYAERFPERVKTYNN